ncbi:unnamed protein product [Linum tenue]|uniref:RING-type E3 ubiquitin transferase n=1 Tax=Linum tenue TaxID=586396 RepID=A0AAV0S3U4_9ROSI|nr:unnamed protein product [Linum tenue]
MSTWVVFETHHPRSLLSSSPSPTSSSSSSGSSSPYDGDYSQKQSSSGGKISPAILFVIVILAVVFFISGLLHLLVRFLMKQRGSASMSDSNPQRDVSGSDAFQRQLQQLFHLHDSGLDQAFIDALPVFPYKDIMGLKEPFDCPVCLCEFSEKDKLRLLPICSHAFHIDCIDTWLLSNSTCPLCRGSLYSAGLSFENPVFDMEAQLLRDEEVQSNAEGSGILVSVTNTGGKKPGENASIMNSKRVFSVRLGKFRSSNNEEAAAERRPAGETSSSNLDARRCFSMGSYQYVVADLELQVTLSPSNNNDNSSSSSRSGATKNMVKGRNGQIETNPCCVDGDADGKRINSRSKGESFSVSKIWQWSRKGKLPSSCETQMSISSSAAAATVPVSVGLLPWGERRAQHLGT